MCHLQTRVQHTELGPLPTHIIFIVQQSVKISFGINIGLSSMHADRRELFSLKVLDDWVTLEVSGCM